MFDLHIDEGHGGSDSGAVGGGLREDDRNLSFGNALSIVAKRCGMRVWRTRTTDTAVSLADRYRKANANRADAFVSIHHDWTGGEQAVIYANSNDTREAKSKRLADAINRRITDPDDGIPDGGIYADRRGLAVLNGTNMPAVIVEVARVQDPYKVMAMAEAVVRGICDHAGLEYKEDEMADDVWKLHAKPEHRAAIEAFVKSKGIYATVTIYQGGVPTEKAVNPSPFRATK